MKQSVAVLGATGSIGTQALDVIRRYPDLFSVCVAAANTSSESLFSVVREFRPKAAVLAHETEIPADLSFCSWYFGPDGIDRALRDTKPDMTLCAIVGIAGLGAVMTALDVSRRVLLANKEALVTGGSLVTEKADRAGVPLLPVDSEHSAIFQALRGTDGNIVSALHLTASGGALRDMPLDSLANAGISDVLRHPTWTMGPKITVDCATMVNKGLEIMEAHHLFRMPEEDIRVVIHPESVVHSMIEYEDGTVSAILAPPDMRGPISYAMAYPRRIPFGGKKLDFASLSALHFSSPDPVRYPALAIARECLRAGGSAPVVFNGSNEYAVSRFLAGAIPFGSIVTIIRECLERVPSRAIRCIEDVREIDRISRETARSLSD